jgi:hypothetical protein
VVRESIQVRSHAPVDMATASPERKLGRRSSASAAAAAGENGQWARVHTVYQSDDEDLESSGGSTFVVDVFDAAIPLDQDAGATAARFA